MNRVKKDVKTRDESTVAAIAKLTDESTVAAIAKLIKDVDFLKKRFLSGEVY